MSEQVDYLRIAKDDLYKEAPDNHVIAEAAIAIAERLDKQNELLGRIAEVLEVNHFDELVRRGGRIVTVGDNQ